MSAEVKIEAIEQFVIAITRQLLRRGVLPGDALEDIRDGARAMAEEAVCPAKRDMAQDVSLLAEVALGIPIIIEKRSRLKLVGGTDLLA